MPGTGRFISDVDGLLPWAGGCPGGPVPVASNHLYGFVDASSVAIGKPTGLRSANARRFAPQIVTLAGFCGPPDWPLRFGFSRSCNCSAPDSVSYHWPCSWRLSHCHSRPERAARRPGTGQWCICSTGQSVSCHRHADLRPDSGGRAERIDDARIGSGAVRCRYFLSCPQENRASPQKDRDHCLIKW